MRKGFLPAVIMASFVSLAALQGCKKDNGLGIDNDKVVKTPYSLYASNNEGWLVHTNDGTTFSSVFPPDGYAASVIATSGNNLLIVKDNLHLSENDGKNFNPVFFKLRKFPWQGMLYDFPRQSRVYVTSQDEVESKGVYYSDDNGKTWNAESAWEPNLPPVMEISSFAGLGNGALFAYSNAGNVLLRKESRDANWKTVTMQGLFPLNGSAYYLVSNNTTLFLIDHTGQGGVWYSEDEGQHWGRIEQNALPRGHRWHCAASPMGGRTILVGTDSMGVYRAENDRMVSSTVGLKKNTSVYSMAVKKNVFKNDRTRTYVFIATNIGIFRSEDFGLTWDKMTSGPYDDDYRSVY